MIQILKSEISQILKCYYHKTYQLDMDIIVEEPKDTKMGDISIPVFQIAKKLEKDFKVCVEAIKHILLNDSLNGWIDEIQLIKGFVNIRIKKDLVTCKVLNEILRNRNQYGTNDIGKGKTVVVEYSSPNIAKPFSVGHLRSTIIGHSLSLLHEKCGYHVVRLNHLGDWGTQFGKLIVAYKKWGNEEDLEENPIDTLLALYVRFHKEAESNPLLEEAGREAFAKLERGNREYHKLWKQFRETSLKELLKMYELLDVSFDSYNGEAFYTNQMPKVIEELKEKGLLIEDDGAQIVRLEDMPPVIIQKSDGSTLYITRDLAAVFYRKKTYQFDKMLYVVGNEQQLHFHQLKEVLKKMGYDWYKQIKHINFGMVLQDGKKMSTRKGKIVKLYDVIEEVVYHGLKHIEENKNEMKNKEKIAKGIGVSAIKYNDLKNHRLRDIEFNLKQMLSFVGNTGPYLQYTSVRITSILNTNEFSKTYPLDKETLKKDHFFEIIRLLDKFEIMIKKATSEEDPSIVCKYAFKLASMFNKFYGIERIVVSNELEKNTKLLMCDTVRTVLNECMRLLSMKIIKKM